MNHVLKVKDFVEYTETVLSSYVGRTKRLPK